MARTAYPTFLTGDSWSAAQANTYWRDNDLAYWVFTTAGDLAYATSSSTLARLAVGSTGQALTVVGGVPNWQSLYPVGIVLTFGVATNPATLLGFGTWTAIEGKVIVGINAADAEFDTLNETGGAKTVTLATSEMPAHVHTQDAHNHAQNAHQHYLMNIENAANAGGSSGNRYVYSGSVSTTSETATNNAATATNQNTGGGGAHNNLQPYQVKYIWERTA